MKRIYCIILCTLSNISIECLPAKTSDLLSESLHASIRSHNIPRTKLILSKNKSLVNVPNVSGNTPLHIAALTGNISLLKILYQYGAKPNTQNKLGLTPLHFLVYTLSEEKLGFFLSLYEPQVNICAKNIGTPLHIVAQLSYNNHETITQMAKLLLAYEAQVNLCNRQGHAPLFFAWQGQNLSLFKLFLQHNASPHYTWYKKIFLSNNKQTVVCTTIYAECIYDIGSPFRPILIEWLNSSFVQNKE